MTDDLRQNSREGEDPPSSHSAPLWLSATIADIADVNFEAPIAKSRSADANELSMLYAAATRTEGLDRVGSPGVRIFQMLEAATGMLFKPHDRNEPFGAMFVLADRRSPVPYDFRGSPIEVLTYMAERAKHPALRARLSDICWLLERKKGYLGAAAGAAYVEIVRLVEAGELSFRFDEEEKGALKHDDARDLLRRALQIGRNIGWDKSESVAAREAVTRLRIRAVESALPIPVLSFSHLDLDFGISEPVEVATALEALVTSLADACDPEHIVEVWRGAARGYHHAGRKEESDRCKVAAAEQLVTIAELQPSHMLGSHILSQAIAEFHGIAGKRDRRKELQHRLVFCK